MNSCNNFSPEELVIVVAKLAERYAGYESTSVSYNTMQLLMDAVLYCINETGNSGSELRTEMTAKEAYDVGYKLVVEKTHDALKMYNRIESCFDDYGMICLHDTMQKGMPEFFRHYDPLYHPQDTLLLLDYPAPKFDRTLTGIDAIYNYLVCIDKEQSYLRQFSRESVIRSLLNYHMQYEQLFESVSELVMRNSQ